VALFAAELASTLKHVQHVRARNTRTKKSVTVNLADVRDLVADWGYLADGIQKLLFRVCAFAQAFASLLLHIFLKQENWKLTEVEVIHDTKRVGSNRPSSERA